MNEIETLLGRVWFKLGVELSTNCGEREVTIHTAIFICALANIIYHKMFWILNNLKIIQETTKWHPFLNRILKCLQLNSAFNSTEYLDLDLKLHYRVYNISICLAMHGVRVGCIVFRPVYLGSWEYTFRPFKKNLYEREVSLKNKTSGNVELCLLILLITFILPNNISIYSGSSSGI